jgi:hypothetical protein
MVLNPVLDECIDDTHIRKKIEMNKKTPTSDRKPRKAKNKIT